MKIDNQEDRIKKIWLKKAENLGYNTVANLMATLYPVDFEAYMIAFELCDSEGDTIDYFTFPIMPTDLNIREEIPTKVENTFGGVYSVSSNVYVPKTVELSGNFGRQFKLLVRNKVEIPLIHKTIQERDYGVMGVQKKCAEVSDLLKTGFGCIKVLQSIINRSVEVDKYGECNKLYMYNLAYGESYVVKPLSFKGFQNMNNNGIWCYEMSLKTVCPLHLDAHKQGKLTKNFAYSTSQLALNGVMSGIRQTLNKFI